MTAAATRTQPRLLNHLVVKLMLPMLSWARNRANRASIGRDEHERLVELAAEFQRREHDSAKRAARVI
ncbi:hypothetical protein GCM10022381_39870 [Leifsonia kafniensis]|uniref:Uncharacterized protein n=1 Tax=Leifsonia kafniensis TaxID=475957 RepID=A0ABP7L3C7_9MICO